MSYLTYILTFGIHGFSNGMRQAYYFNKPYIMHTFGISEFFLGAMDMILSFSIAFGCLMRYSLMKGHDLTALLLKTGVVCSLASAIIPYLSYIYQLFPHHESLILTQVILGGSYFLIGLYKFAQWPMCLRLLTQHFTYKSHACLFGFWGSSWETGNIFCLLIANVMVHQMALKWETSIFFTTAIYLLFSLFGYFFVQDREKQLEGQNTEEVSTCQFFSFSKQSIRNPLISSYLYISAMCSATYFSILMWLPSFFYSVGFGDISGYLSLLFNLAAIFASFTYSSFLEDPTNDSSENELQSIDGQTASNPIKYAKRFLPEFSTFCCILICLGFIIVEHSVSYYVPLTLLLGFFMGGIYNTLCTKDVTAIFEKDSDKTEMIIYLTFAINKLTVATFQILIGLTLSIHLSAKQSANTLSENNKSYEAVFYIIIVTLLLTLVGFIVRSCIRNRIASENAQNN